MKHALRMAVDKLREKGEAEIAEKLLAVYARTRRRGGRTLKQGKAAKQKERKERMAQMYAAVSTRAGGMCEACHGSFVADDPAELDHLIRGAGARRVYESESTVWLIHRSCHRARHAARPVDGWSWPERERAHVAAHWLAAPLALMRRWARSAEARERAARRPF